MSRENKGLPIIANGEKLAEPIKKRLGGGEKNYPRDYDTSKRILLSDVKDIKNIIKKEDKHLLEEVVVCVRMAEGFMAKSFEPKVVEREGQMKYIGARNYELDMKEFKENHDKEDENYERSISKLYFLRTTIEGLEKFEKSLETDKFKNADSLSNQIRSIQKIDLLLETEKALGFDENWEFGRVEIVLHPFEKSKLRALDIVKEILRKSEDNEFLIKEYSDGPIFISARINKSAVREISRYNFLRTVHPMGNIKIPQMRNTTIALPAPKPVSGSEKSTIKVGVFDGGASEDAFLLNNFVTINNNTISTDMYEEYIEHGSAVCGAVLYGPLNKYDISDTVEKPSVSVESFRVLPTKNPGDFDLYEVVDIIESVVPDRTDIGIFNISLGPQGPILDDQISRFTYSLDKLSYDYEVLFCVAVGNDGNLQEPLNRIQSPSDLVNGLGVGAYTFDNNSGEKIHASYSCIGEGREGCKIKPDIAAFGGCWNRPFHGVSFNSNQKYITLGTSFASPTAAGMAGKMMAYSNDITPQIARTLLIHTANNPSGSGEKRLGYGCIGEFEGDILNCTEKEVTILYNGKIEATQHMKLPIPMPDFSKIEGNIEFRWTMATLSDPNILDSDGYTSCCIEDTFYPNSELYTMRNGGKSRRVNISTEQELIESLENQGFKISSVPVSDSGTDYKTEEERRISFKWDTVVRRKKQKRRASVKDPFIIIHGMNRSSVFDSKIKFSAAVTISIQSYSGNLHNDILSKYRVLQPIKLRQKNEIMVSI